MLPQGENFRLQRQGAWKKKLVFRGLGKRKIISRISEPLFNETYKAISKIPFTLQAGFLTKSKVSKENFTEKYLLNYVVLAGSKR